MTTEVAKFDPSTYVDKVRDKIKQSLVDVIPDEQWDAMLRAEIAAFFKPSPSHSPATHSHYGVLPSERPSEFHRIVTGVLEEEVKKRARAVLDGPDWQSYWDGTRQRVGEEIGRIARENGHLILAKWLEAAIAQVIDHVRFSPHG